MDNSIKWTAPEYQHYKRSNDWYWAVGIITICVATLAFIFDNALFGVLIIISAAILISFTIRQPKEVEYEINSKGLRIGADNLTYQSLESFWIETRNNEPRILIRSKKMLSPLLIIPIPEEDTNAINTTLEEFLPEKEMHEPTAHHIMRYLGF